MSPVRRAQGGQARRIPMNATLRLRCGMHTHTGVMRTSTSFAVAEWMTVASDHGAPSWLAVCLVGFVRTLASPKVHASLSAFFRSQDSSADFFGVVATGAEDSAKGQYAPVPAASLEGALRVLRPIAWIEPRLVDPPCGLPCMQQFVRLGHCAELVAAHERARARAYAWVVKARPDIFFPDASIAIAPQFAANHLRSQSVIHRDRTAGDMLVYIPRRELDTLTRALVDPCGGPSVRCARNATCKCNVMLARIIGERGLEQRYHPLSPQVLRTPEAQLLIDTLRNSGLEPMKLLHNVTPGQVLASRRGAEVGHSQGYCGVTKVSRDDLDACTFGASGSWQLELSTRPFDAEATAEAAGKCAALCAQCTNCVYMSYSAIQRDCSWYSHCNVSKLSNRVQGFFTAQVKSRLPRHLARTLRGAFNMTAESTHSLGINRRPRTQVCRSPSEGSTSTSRRLAWLGLPPEDCTIDNHGYYCAWFRALNASASGPLLILAGQSRNAQLPHGTVVILPNACTQSSNMHSLHECMRRLAVIAHANPCLLAVLQLHKIFEGLDEKLRIVREQGAGTLAKIFVPDASSSLLDTVARGSGLPTAFLAYAAPEDTLLGRGVPEGREYSYDFGFSGGWQQKSSRYAFRGELLRKGGVVEQLNSQLRVFLPRTFLPWDAYTEALWSTRVWLSTTEGSSMGPRFYEVMLSGRAMLLCDRNAVAYDAVGIVEGRHAAMFNSSSEFKAVLRHYLTHEPERLRLVRAARKLVLRRHTWSVRAREFVEALPS